MLNVDAILFFTDLILFVVLFLGRKLTLPVDEKNNVILTFPTVVV